MDVDYFKAIIKRHGVPRTVLHSAYIILNRLIGLKLYYCVELRQKNINSKYFKIDNQFQFTKLDFKQLSEYCDREGYRLSKKFLNTAEMKSDLCYGFFNNRKLVAYNWFYRKPTLVGDGKFEMRFGDEYLFMSWGYTLPDFRGQRLHAVGMANALQKLSKNRYKGLVGIIAGNNFDSLNSCIRLGFKRVGNFICAKIFKRYFIFSTGKNKHLGFELRATNPATDGRIEN